MIITGVVCQLTYLNGRNLRVIDQRSRYFSDLSEKSFYYFNRNATSVKGHNRKTNKSPANTFTTKETNN